MSSVKLIGIGNDRLDVCLSFRIGEKGLLEPVELWGLLPRRNVIQLLLILRHRQGRQRERIVSCGIGRCSVEIGL